VYLPLEKRTPKTSNHTSDHTDLLKPRRLDRIRHVIRFKNFNTRTGQAYVEWIKRVIIIHDCRHPGELEEKYIGFVHK